VTAEKSMKDIQRIERELAGKRTALDEAEAAQAEAERKYDASLSDADLDIASKARLKFESAVRVLQSTQEALEQARAEHKRLHVAGLVAELAAGRPKLEAWEQGLPIDAFVAIDAQLDSTVLLTVRVVAAAQAEHDRLFDIAQQAGQRFDRPRPTIADALLKVQRELAGLREKEDRDPVGDWLSDPPMRGMWQAHGMSANELQTAQRMSQMHGGPTNGR
jgi:hypothetical protein